MTLLLQSFVPVHVLHFCSNLVGCHSVKIMSHVCVLIVNAFLKICGVLSNNACSEDSCSALGLIMSCLENFSVLVSGKLFNTV